MPYQSQRIQPLSEALRLEQHPQLVERGNLLLGQVARVTILLLCRLGREVIVVVLGVDIHGGVRDEG